MQIALKISFENAYYQSNVLRSLPGHIPLARVLRSRRVHGTEHNLKLGTSKAACGKRWLTFFFLTIHLTGLLRF